MNHDNDFFLMKLFRKSKIEIFKSDFKNYKRAISVILVCSREFSSIGRDNV